MTQVKFLSSLGRAVGKKIVSLDLRRPIKLRDVLAAVAMEIPSPQRKAFLRNGALRDGVVVLVNGRSPDVSDGMNTAVHDKDRVVLFNAVGGGFQPEASSINLALLSPSLA